MLFFFVHSKSKRISPEHLQIEWRPLYKLVLIYVDKKSTKGQFYRFYSYVLFHISCAPSLLTSMFVVVRCKKTPRARSGHTGRPKPPTNGRFWCGICWAGRWRIWAATVGRPN